MKIIVKLFFLSSFLLLKLHSFGDNPSYIYDVYGGAKLLIRTYNEETSKGALEYPQIEDIESESVKKINDRIKYLMIDHIDTDSFQNKYSSYLSECYRSYLFIHTNQKPDSNQEYYRDENEDFDASYTISYNCDSILSLLIQYETRLSTDYPYYINHSVHFYRNYFFNIQSGQEYTQRELLDSDISMLIEEKIASTIDNFQKQIVPLVHEEEEDFNTLENLRLEIKNRKKELINFDAFKDGFFYPLANAFLFIIPPLNQSTQNITDESICIRVPFREVSPLVLGKSPFRGIKKIVATEKIGYKNFYNPPEKLFENFLSRKIDLPLLNNDMPKFKGINSINVYQQYKQLQGADTVEVKRLLYTYAINAQGYIANYARVSDFKSSYAYKGHNLISSLDIWSANDDTDTCHTIYRYDKNRNLQSVQSKYSISNPDERKHEETTVFTQHNGFILVESYATDQPENIFTHKILLDDYDNILHTLGFDYTSEVHEFEYNYDKKNRITYIKDKHNWKKGNQYIYDRSDQLIERIQGQWGIKETFKYNQKRKLVEVKKYERSEEYNFRKSIEYNADQLPVVIKERKRQYLNKWNETIYLIEYN